MNYLPYTSQCFAIALIWKMMHRIVQHCNVKDLGFYETECIASLDAIHMDHLLQYYLTMHCNALCPRRVLYLYETESIALNCTLLPCSRLQCIACYCNAEDVGRSTPGSWELPATTPPTSTNSRRTSCKYQYVYFIQIPIKYNTVVSVL